MVNKVNGYATAGEFLTKNMDFFDVSVATTDVRPTGVSGDKADVNPAGVYPITVNGVAYNDATAYDAARAKQVLFDKIIATISTRAQPIIIGTVAFSTNSTFKFAVEHKDAWTAADLKTALDAATGKTFTITLSDTL